MLARILELRRLVAEANRLREDIKEAEQRAHVKIEQARSAPNVILKKRFEEQAQKLSENIQVKQLELASFNAQCRALEEQLGSQQSSTKSV